MSSTSKDCSLGASCLVYALVASLSCLSLHFWILLSSATSLMGWAEKTTAGRSSWCWWPPVGGVLGGRRGLGIGEAVEIGM